MNTRTDCNDWPRKPPFRNSILQFIAVSRSEPWRTVVAQLEEADAISTLAFLPILAGDKFIVVYLRSIPVILSKIPAQQSLTLRWRSIWDMVTILWEAYSPRKAAGSPIIDHWRRIAAWFSKMGGLKLLTLDWCSILGSSDDVVNSILAVNDGR